MKYAGTRKRVSYIGPKLYKKLKQQMSLKSCSKSGFGGTSTALM
jgi:hypothetical protein